MPMSASSKADAFAEQFRKLCEQHKQDAVVLVYMDPDSNDQRMVSGPRATSEWLNRVASAVKFKASMRKNNGIG